MELAAYERVKTNYEFPKQDDGGPVSDFYRSAYQAIAIEPLKAVTQMVNHVSPYKLPEVDLIVNPNKNNWTKAGNFVGTVLEFSAISYATGKMTAGTTLAGPVARGLINGVALGAVTPSYDSGNFWLNKGRTAAVYAGTFAAMGGASKVISGMEFLGANGTGTFMQQVGHGALTGGVGGFANAELGSILHGNGLAKGQEVFNSVVMYSAFGGLSAAAQYGIERIPSLLERGVKNVVALEKANRAPYSMDTEHRRIRFGNRNPVLANYGADGQVNEVLFRNGEYFNRYWLSEVEGKPVWQMDVYRSTGFELAGRPTVYAAGVNTDASFKLDADGRGLQMNYRPIPFPPLQGPPGGYPIMTEHLRLPEGTNFVNGWLPKF